VLAGLGFGDASGGLDLELIFGFGEGRRWVGSGWVWDGSKVVGVEDC
jgi:hypothetical protein